LIAITAGGEINQFFLAEVEVSLFEDGRQHMSFADLRYRFGPGKRRTLTLGKEWRLFPRDQRVPTMHYQNFRRRPQDDFCLSRWYKSPIVRQQLVGEHGYWAWVDQSRAEGEEA
jgi:hypothetical protein